MARTAQDIVRTEVYYCVSSLVSTLAPHWGALDLSKDTTGLSDLFEQAGQLASPIDDWEEAAIQAGWKRNGTDGFINESMSRWRADASEWQELCENFEIEPYAREVFEHWIVSDWLAEKLEAKGEKVDRDFAGMTVWARTTTGQAIYADGLMEAIAAELNGEA